MTENPIFDRELTRIRRTPGQRAMTIIYNILLWVAGIGALIILYRDAGGISGIDREWTHRLYVILSLINGLLVLLLLPGLLSGSISREWEGNTFDILLVTGIPHLQIVTGKLLAGVTVALLTVVTTLPLLWVILMAGGVFHLDILLLFLLLFVMAMFTGAVSLFISALIGSTQTAMICSYAFVIINCAGVPLLSRLLQNVSPVFGFTRYILMLNPFATLLLFLTQQTGNERAYTALFEYFGFNASGIAANNFYTISLMVQSIFCALTVIAATAVIGKKSIRS